MENQVKPKWYKNKNFKKNMFVLAFLIYPLILFSIFYVGVNINSIILAFKEYNFVGDSKWVGFENFKKFITDISGKSEKMTIGLTNSLKMYIIALVITLPLYILLSYILFKKCFAHKALRLLVMIPQIISVFVMSLVFLRFVEGAFADIMISVFKLDSFPNLLWNPKYSFGTTMFYMIWVSFSVSLIVYPNAMNEIDPAIIEAAQLDGANNIFQELWYIILPLIFPTISTFLITGFAGILTTAGVIPLFYMYSAPPEVFNIGYYYWSAVATSSNYSGYPVLAAGGIMMTIVVAPLTLGIKKLLEKLGPTVDF